MKNLPPLLFTVGFLVNGKDILLLQRNKAPNQGKWNGVGGHIEAGESPYQSMLREIEEETGMKPGKLHFGGILTWEGFEIETGGLYIFSASVDSRSFVENGEGSLAWHPLQFAFSDPAVVENIHYFLAPVLSGSEPVQYHFQYQDSQIIARSVQALPSEVDIHKIFHLPGKVSQAASAGV